MTGAGGRGPIPHDDQFAAFDHCVVDMRIQHIELAGSVPRQGKASLERVVVLHPGIDIGASLGHDDTLTRISCCRSGPSRRRCCRRRCRRYAFAGYKWS
ncbi:hypothetical protein D3C76_1501820 [compost metagenome]